jgi:phage/plasmid primase-like uncharacterized protein
MSERASNLARGLALCAEAVCCHYLPAGRREGAYWRVGDVSGAPGRSLYLRLHGPTAGKWVDAATGEHGDLIDLICARQGLASLSEALDEASCFLALPQPAASWAPAAAPGSQEAARRLFAAGRAIQGTPAERYLRWRGLVHVRKLRWLRFHPRCFHRDDHSGDTVWPALLAGVTDLAGELCGLQRTWLTAEGRKAPVADPRRALGVLVGHAVWFGAAADVLVVGEGVETVLSIRDVLPSLPCAAALSAAHVAAFQIPPPVRRLYIAFDDDPAGRHAADRLAARARAIRVETILLQPRMGDFNDDLQRLGREGLAASLRPQLARQDRARVVAHY